MHTDLRFAFFSERILSDQYGATATFIDEEATAASVPVTGQPYENAIWTVPWEERASMRRLPGNADIGDLLLQQVAIAKRAGDGHVARGKGAKVLGHFGYSPRGNV